MEARLVFLIVSCATLGGMHALGDDHGNSPPSSTALPVGSLVSGILESSDDVDCFHTVTEPNKWYGWALFDLQREMPFVVYNTKADWFGSRPNDVFGTWIWKEWDFPFATTSFPAVIYRENYFGSETDYQLAAVEFPTTASPNGSLIEFTLSQDNPVDTRLFTFAPGSGTKVVCMSSLDRMGGDADPQLVGATDSWQFGLSANTTARHVRIINERDDITELRTLVHNRGAGFQSGGSDRWLRERQGFRPMWSRQMDHGPGGGATVCGLANYLGRIPGGLA